MVSASLILRRGLPRRRCSARLMLSDRGRRPGNTSNAVLVLICLRCRFGRLPLGRGAKGIGANQLMKTPPHPGRIVREDCLAPLGLTVTEGARILASPDKH